MQNATILRLLALFMALGTLVQASEQECILHVYCVFKHKCHENVTQCMLNGSIKHENNSNSCDGGGQTDSSCLAEAVKECLKNLVSCPQKRLTKTCDLQHCCKLEVGGCHYQELNTTEEYARENCTFYCRQKGNCDYIGCTKDTLCQMLCACKTSPCERNTLTTTLDINNACGCNGENTTTISDESTTASHTTETSSPSDTVNSQTSTNPSLPSGTTKTSRSSTESPDATETNETPTAPYISISSENTMPSAPYRDRKNGGPDVAAAVVGALVAVLLATGVAVVIICWWRRRRSSSGAEKSPEAAFSAARSKAAASTDPINHNETELTASTNRNSEHVYTQIDSPTSERQAGDESMYSELDDVTGRKLPTAPALGDNYSLAHNPDQPQPMQGTTTSASVYNLAHNPEAEVANTPKYFILEEEGKGSSGDDQSAGGQYFILEEGAADAENEGKKLKAPQGAVTMHGAHEYSSLASTGRAENRNDPGAEYTPLNKTSTDKQGAQSANGEGLKKDGQYFILEEGTAEDGEDKGNGGQYFILEEDAANENKDGQQGGQYFILEEGAAAVDDSQDDAAERDYSHLNPADMGDKSSDRNEYTPLGFVAEDPAEKPATTTNEYFELESDYSLQKTV